MLEQSYILIFLLKKSLLIFNMQIDTGTFVVRVYVCLKASHVLGVHCRLSQGKRESGSPPPGASDSPFIFVAWFI